MNKYRENTSGEGPNLEIEVYPIRRSGDTAQTQHQLIMQAIQQSHAELNRWHEDLPAELKLVNGVARERGVLWLHSLYNEVSTMGPPPARATYINTKNSC